MRILIAFIFVLFSIIFVERIRADTIVEDINSEVINKRSYDMYNKLRCVVCQGQTLAESESDIAKIIKFAIKDRLVKGHSEAEILSWLSDKYGDYIFLDPKFNKQTWPLWFVPFTTILLILLITTLFVIRKNRNV